MPPVGVAALLLTASLCASPATGDGLSYAAGATLGPSALFGGGSSSDDCTAGFLGDVFDPADPDVLPDPLSVARCGLAAGSLTSGVLVFAGGHDSSGYLDVLDVYRGPHRDAEATLSLSGKRSYPVAASDGSCIFISGGWVAWDAAG